MTAMEQKECQAGWAVDAEEVQVGRYDVLNMTSHQHDIRTLKHPHPFLLYSHDASDYC